jgi:hypothetical protein
MPRIHPEYDEYSPDFNELTPEEVEEITWQMEMDELLCLDLEVEFDDLNTKKKIRLTGKFKEKHYIP